MLRRRVSTKIGTRIEFASCGYHPDSSAHLQQDAVDISVSNYKLWIRATQAYQI